MKKLLLAATIGALTLTSCEKKSEDHATHEATTEHQNHESMDDKDNADHEPSEIKLKLNDGKKWEMNAEMKPYINDMEQQIIAYNPKTDDYKMLAKNLSETNENLIKSCTIKGTPHEVLHAWLMPHMEKIEQLKNAQTKEDADKIVGDLKRSMTTYHEYFN